MKLGKFGVSIQEIGISSGQDGEIASVGRFQKSRMKRDGIQLRREVQGQVEEVMSSFKITKREKGWWQ